MGWGIGDVECMPTNILVGLLNHLFLEFVMFGLFSCRGCWVPSITLALGSELFITVAGQDWTTMHPTVLLMLMVLLLILVCLVFTTHPTFTLAMCPSLTLAPLPTLTACLVQLLLSVITPSSLGTAVFMHSMPICLGTLPGGGILQVRLRRDLGPLTLLVL